MSSSFRFVAVLVVVAVMSGGGYAVAANLIRSKDVADGSLRCKDLRPRLCDKIRKGGQTGPQGPQGPQGAPGQSGPQGPPGPAGADAVTRVKALLPDPGNGDGVAPPDWAERPSAGCDPAAVPGDASVAGNRLHFSLGNDGGWGAVSVSFNGYNGVQLKDLSLISYHAKYDQTGTDFHGGTPYFRIYTEDFANSIIYSPNTQPGAIINSGEWQKFNVTEGTVRHNDDGGNFPDITWADLIEQHGDEEIAQIRLTAGCAGNYSNQTEADADNLTIVSGGQKKVFDFGS